MVERISLMQAYVIEALKEAGFSDDHIIEKTHAGKLAEITEGFEARLDFDLLYEIKESLPVILEDGYQVKFLTFPGLQRLLEIKVEKLEGKDYTIDGFTVRNLSLTPEEAAIVTTFLSDNWSIEKTIAGYRISSK